MRVNRAALVALLLSLPLLVSGQGYYPPAGGGPVTSTSVTSGTMGDGNFVFRDAITIGADGTTNTSTTPAAGWSFIPKPSPGGLPEDIQIINSLGRYLQIRTNDTYTMLMAAADLSRELYLDAVNTVLHNQSGNKVRLHNSNNQSDTLVIGPDSASESTSSDTQTVQAFDGYTLPGVLNQHGGFLRLAGGRSTGTGVPGYLIFATSEQGAVSGQTVQPLTPKLYVKDALQFVATGLTKPTCDVNSRFKIWPVAGGAGVADTFEVCTKDAANVYAWRSLS